MNQEINDHENTQELIALFGWEKILYQRTKSQYMYKI